MNVKIVADSSSNLRFIEGIQYSSVPLKIVTDSKEYVDDDKLDTLRMVEELAEYKGKSSTSCPSIGDWLEAFGDSEYIFTVAITSNLSGSHSAAVQAKDIYEEQNPGRRVCNLDTLSTGPEMVLIVEKLKELIQKGLAFDDIEVQIREYMNKTHLMFMLESIDNLAKNGRVSALIAKTVGFLNIRIVGKASEEGTLEQLHKCRGEKKGLEILLRQMKALGFTGGKVHIAHSSNPCAAEALKEMLQKSFANTEISIVPCGGLCSFYAEKGGLLVGFEG